MSHYKVGRGRPPAASQFRKGQSGNPKGRPRKGSLPSNGVLASEIIKIGSKAIRLTMDGQETNVPLAEAVLLKQAQQAASGNRLAALSFLDQYEAAVAAQHQDEQERYAFWRGWRRRHGKAPLNLPPFGSRTLALPHPRDIRIDPVSHAIHFSGPMDRDELGLFMLPVVAAEICFLEAELSRRKSPTDGAYCDQLQKIGVAFHKMAAPSLGGMHPDDPPAADQHRRTVIAMENWVHDTKRLLMKRRTLMGEFAGVVSHLSPPSPGGCPGAELRTPLQAVGTAKLRVRRCALSRNRGARSELHRLIAKGDTINLMAQDMASHGISRSAVGRYVLAYHSRYADLEHDPSADLKQLLQSVPPYIQRLWQDVVRIENLLANRDMEAREAMRRAELPAEPLPTKPKGLSKEGLDYIKAQLLGMPAEPPDEPVD